MIPCSKFRLSDDKNWVTTNLAHPAKDKRPCLPLGLRLTSMETKDNPPS